MNLAPYLKGVYRDDDCPEFTDEVPCTLSMEELSKQRRLLLKFLRSLNAALECESVQMQLEDADVLRMLIKILPTWRANVSQFKEADPIKHTIETVQPHHLTTGSSVMFFQGEGKQVEGLTDGEVYYVRVEDGEKNTFTIFEKVRRSISASLSEMRL